MTYHLSRVDAPMLARASYWSISQLPDISHSVRNRGIYEDYPYSLPAKGWVGAASVA